MRFSLRVSAIALLTLGLLGCDDAPRFEHAEPGEALSAGSATVMKFDQNAFSLPSANLPPMRRLDFSVGNSFFRNPWVIAPASTTARDGLGPLLNTNACQNCHIKDGRGHPPESDSDNAVSMLVRLSIPAGPEHAEVVRERGIAPEPNYGGQLQDMAIPGVSPEARIRLTYSTHSVRFADGSEVELRKPELQLSELAYGDMHPHTQFSLRIAPPMIGLGLLEAIPQEALLANADPDDRNGDGISGRPNRVFDQLTRETVIGRFGWKAGQPNLNQQNADAFFNDMGLSTHVLSGSSCTESQTECRALPNGGEPEVSEQILAQVLFYTRNLGVPARRGVDDPQVLAGKTLFHRAGCQSCHVPQFTTRADAAEPEQANQPIRPYTDLLLHDMGDGLADLRPEFEASGREWRTPPLWGIGLTETVSGTARFLHDGRARTLLEAVLWHGGEAEAARQAVLAFDQSERAALVRFLESL
ncbi:c-type cytochrome [Stutzerimonas stutzeri]|uniref:di-heme oxidoreductase family protein n=1 Tax=Stutzerimonas sp. S1 TaxID=3030652 RepID=UPI00222512F2|nr:di-heme oxidoredictase family protein [Stutzerimonas sp. S1]MCW3148302.1 c-type cytochrome [Stutzerimonas sp. S1]